MRDLLSAAGYHSSKLLMGPIEVVAQKVDNPLDYSRILKAALRSRETDALKINKCHLYGLIFFNIGIALLSLPQFHQNENDFAVFLCNLYDSITNFVHYFFSQDCNNTYKMQQPCRRKEAE